MERRTLQQTIERMREYILQKTDAAFSTAEEIENEAIEVYSDEQDSELLRPIAERITREAVQAHRAAEKNWPPVTDCDLLDRAFHELEGAGVVARHDFTCCGT
jgi:hypothetical protein